MKRVAVITGAGRGIGRATAVLAGSRGYAVCVNYLRDEAAEQLPALLAPQVQRDRLLVGVHGEEEQAPGWIAASLSLQSSALAAASLHPKRQTALRERVAKLESRVMERCTAVSFGHEAQGAFEHNASKLPAVHR